jgi:coiled-coil domain-containing protein 55
LLNSAATRRLDRLRAEEKMLQREREAEGDEYAGKEEFVTQAYKDQMAEVRRAEEEETAREGLPLPRLRTCTLLTRCTEAEKKKRGGQPAGLARFYQQMLNQSDTQHQEAVAATLKTAQGPAEPAPSAATNLTILRPPAAGAAPGPAPAPPPDLARKNDLQLAQEAGAQGKNVELNDDNQIVDKRELLSAGLNLSAPNTRRLGIGRAAAGAGAADAPVQTHRAVGAAASRREINERRAREVQTQLRQEEERVAQEREREEAERLQRVVAKRNQDTDVQDARERYLARKRRKLEQPDGAAPEAVA